MEILKVGERMLGLNLLIIILILEFVLTLLIFKNDILAPAVPLSASFLVAVLDLKLMETYWSVELVDEAVWAIGCGNLAFILTAFMVQLFKKKKRRNSIEIAVIHIDKNLIVFMDFLYSLVIGIYLIFVVIAARRYGATGSVFSMVGFLSRLSVEDNNFVPSIVMSIYNLCINMTYVWVYTAVVNYRKTKLSAPWFVLLVLSFSMGLLVSGSRGELISLIVFAVVIFLLIYRRQQSRKIPLKYYWRMGIGLVGILCLFQFIATFMGRDSYRYNFMEYLSIYIGAPIMNFSNAIRYSMSKSVYFGQETFHKLIELLGPFLGIEKYESSRLFWSANGHNVGNVATMYYDYYHDWGMTGAIVLPIIMALILQPLYENVKKQRKNGICLSYMLYAWMLFLLMRSFFSNTFISVVFSASFVKQIVVWYLASRYLVRLRINWKS